MKKVSIFLILFALALSPIAWAMAKKPAPVLPPSPASLPPLTLEEAYQHALKRSEVLAIKGVDIESTWGDFLIASSQSLGRVNYEITDFLQEKQSGSGDASAVGSSISREETRTRKLVFSQPIFHGFKSIGALAGAGSLRNERVYEKKRAEQLLFMDVASAFLLIKRYQKEVKILEQTYNLLLARGRDLGEREQIGKSRRSEITEAQTRMQNVQSDLAESEGDLEIQTRILEFLTGLPLIGRSLEEVSHLQEAPEMVENYLPDVEERFDVQATHAAMKVAFQHMVIVQSELWPNVTLDSNLYDKREGFQSNIDWDVLFTIKIPLFQGGAAMGELKTAYSDWKRAKLVYQKTKREAELDLKRAYASWISSQKQFRALEEALKTSEENYRLQQEDYQRNLVSNLDVLSGLESLNQTRQRNNEIFYLLEENYWRFQIARGNCCESI